MQAVTSIQDCRYGKMLYFQKDWAVSKAIKTYGEWCQLEMDVISPFIQEGNTVLDIDAHLGTHTLFFAQQVGHQGRVIAFEPQAFVYYSLCANIAMNHHQHVECLHAACGDVLSAVEIPKLDYSTFQNFGGLRMSDHGHTETATYPVPQLTIDSISLSDCHFIKSDVEGMEMKVLRGAYKTLKAFKPVLFLEFWSGQDSTPFIQLLVEDLNYELYKVRTPYFNPDNFLKHSENIYNPPHAGESHLLAIPRESEYRELPELSKYTRL